MKLKGDKLFLGLTFALVAIGILIFISASLAIYARDQGQFTRMLLNHGVLGLGGGIVVFFVVSRLKLELFQKYGLLLFILAIVGTMLVFVPGLGFSHGGATRWIDIGPLSLQPAEFLKLASVIVYASWLAHARKRVHEFKYGLLPLFVILVLVGGVLLAQPDTDGFLTIAGALVVLYFLAGGLWKHLALIAIIGAVGFAGLVATRPYLLSRIKTFMDPSVDATGSSWQIQQSMIALGSGGIWGRGFGQSVQKFRYLPEPVNDSIFAVFGEEFGFVGTTALILLYLAFFLRGLRIARGATTSFGTLLASGILVMMIAQALFNIASTAGLIPLAGLPLVFISQGGTAMVAALFGAGLVYAVSKRKKTSSD